MQGVLMLTVIMPSVIMPSVLMVTVIMPSVILPGVVALFLVFLGTDKNFFFSPKIEQTFLKRQELQFHKPGQKVL
jgi:hypothetical protein